MKRRPPSRRASSAKKKSSQDDSQSLLFYVEKEGPKPDTLPDLFGFNGKSSEDSKPELEFQKQRYEAFVRNSSEGIWRIEFKEPISVIQSKDRIAKKITDEGVIVDCNQALAKMYGFQDPAELLGKHPKEFIADMEGYITSKIKFAEQNFSITNIETKEIDRLGNVHYFENSYIGEVRDSHLVYIWGIQRDITEKRSLQEQLRASENRYRNLVEQANDMVILLNEKCELVFANKRFFALTQYVSEEIVGKSFSIIVAPSEVEFVMEQVRSLFGARDRQLRCSIKVLTKFNEERVVDFSMTALSIADNMSGILAIGRDVTVEQSVKTALRESEEKYRSLVEHSLLGVLVIQNDVIIYGNPTLGNLFETDLDSLIGMSLDSFVHPNDYVQLYERFSEASGSPNRDIRFTIRVMTKSGKTKVLEGWAAGITYVGKPAIQAVVVDVTETKRLEEQLIQSQKMESIGQLASGIAHDFNNLLGSIYATIDILKKKFDSSDQNLKKYLDILDTSANRAADLTSQLLTFSRQHESKVKPVRLNDLVNDSVKILTRSIGKNIKIESVLDPMLYIVEVDASQIESAIINLCINARDAMPNGGTLRIETSNVEFTRQRIKQIPDAQPGKYASLAISDTGMGMSREIQRKIFEPFFTTKPIGKGTGLGLSIVYGIVRNHKGLINVYSEQGRGSTFRLYFPASEKEPFEETASGFVEVPHGTETILIIDDEAILLDLTREILEGLGYKVLTAEGAKLGIDSFKEHHPKIDLVILDMLMPEMTGTEVYPILKSINHRCPVLVATGLSVGERVDGLVAMGVRGVVGKPYSMIDLASHVRKAIDGW